MNTRKVALYATNTMADWEYAYLTTQIVRAEEAKPGRFELVLAGDGLDPVTTLGGLPVQPQVDLADIAADESLAMLVIPGGDHYEAGHERLIEVVSRLLDQNVPVAAICGATFLLARTGLLDERRHTSNDPAYLAMSGYAGHEKYVLAPVVTDHGITTGSGIHPVPFTAEVMRRIGLYPDDIIAAWERLYTTGQAESFYALMEATHAWQNSGR